MRTLEEIRADIDHARRQRDAVSLRSLAQELQGLGTDIAEAYAQSALGSADILAGQYPAGQAHFQRALTFFEEQQDQRAVARVTSSLGQIESLRGNYTLALELFRRVLAVHENLGDRKAVAYTMWTIGNVYLRTGDNPLALKTYRQTLEMFEEMEDTYGISSVIGNIGLVYIATSDYPSALEYLRRSLAMNEEQGNRAGVVLALGSIGRVYSSVGDHTLALELLHKALVLHEELDDPAGVAIVTSNIGNVYGDLLDFPQALAHFRHAQEMFEELGNTALATEMVGKIITTLIGAGDFEEARQLLKRQEETLDASPSSRSDHLVSSARIAEHDQDFDAAHRHLLTALKYDLERGTRDRIAEWHKLLRDLAQKRNDFAGYIEHNNEYNRITEEIRGKEATQRLAMMEAERKIEAELRERDKERALLYGALPESVATRMLRGEDVSGDHFDNAAVLFLDIVGFTAISEQLHPGQVVQFLEHVFSSLDEICKKHELTKIKTIGDSYLAVAFSEQPNNRITEQPKASNEQRAASAALEMLDAVSKIMLPNGSPEGSPERSHVSVRIGLHAGAVTAGVLGKERLQYDVWGDTVNVASRMESTGEPGKIHVSEQFASLLTSPPSPLDHSNTSPPSPLSSMRGGTSLTPLDLERGGAEGAGVRYQMTHRGETEVKGKGLMQTYWLERLV